MWFWNRREVYHGYDMKEQADVREILSTNKIKYDIRVLSHSGQQRGRTGSFGLSKRFEKEYYIYVSKDNFEHAKFVLGR
ncbi:MAG: hypothetical protein K0S41_526 [Anaerocolumna sp.]|jgi:hypothetical protein|nr:hypothetical protein [Anaerocolumna sp.]